MKGVQRLNEVEMRMLMRGMDVVELPVDVCGCGCGCEADGDWHWSQRPWCPCLRQDCVCVTDRARHEQLIAYPGD